MYKDIVIIGGGVAGLQLAVAFAKDGFFLDREIAIIEPSAKTKNDKTFCFWEKGTGPWDSIVFKKWSRGRFLSKNHDISLCMSDYQYKMVRSIDFYNYTKSIIDSTDNIKWINDEVIEVKNQKIVMKQLEIEAGEIFDSRIAPHFGHDPSSSINLIQHFKGWVISTPKDCFNPGEFTMMDYRVRHREYTAFNYVLPLSESKALVEYTLFSPGLINDEEYDKYLKAYIEDCLDIRDYQIEEIEVGRIPMSTFAFEKENRDFYTKIGTAGGWVKASTGYSFKRTGDFVEKIITNLKFSRKASENFFKSRYKMYDTLLLHRLFQNNSLGEYIFETLYDKVPADLIFKFLDEKTTFREDFRIMGGLPPLPFIRAFFTWYLLRRK